VFIGVRILVALIRQKFALGAANRFRRFLGVFQLKRSNAHLLFEPARCAMRLIALPVKSQTLVNGHTGYDSSISGRASIG
jgi:hypothetical protein